uniref:non-specific serine/threonine protein kinase n=1 Tax=Noccaea caerulescens TaxID=107243 RepID=A0A1J3I8C3_NOCCA
MNRLSLFFFFFLAFLYTVTTLAFLPLTATGATSCRKFCGSIPINYPFGIDQGCGSPQFKGMFNCSTDLFFLTPSGSYKVQRIDYEKNTMVVFDPAMSTCSILQPHHDFKLADIQSAVIRPSYDTVFALLNCSNDSPVHNRFRNLCFNASGHSCDELYSSCTSFRIFNTTSPSGNSTVHTTPYCCFTSYDTVRAMSLNILDCSHYTTVIDSGRMRDAAPLDWSYGIELSYSVPEIGCDRCRKSGGTCGFDADTEIFLCQCPTSNNNPTRECGGGMTNHGSCNSVNLYHMTLLLAMLMSFIYAIL